MAWIALILCPDVQLVGAIFKPQREFMRYLIVLIAFLSSISQVLAFHQPEKMLEKIKKSQNPGKAVFKAYCANCHAKEPLINLGAPRIGVKVDWQPRLKQSYKRLLQHTFEGINAMPARGGCFECDDKLIEQTVAYMIGKTKPKA